MGWISDRHMRQVGSLNSRPSRQRKGPLKPLNRIVSVLRPSTGIFDPAWVELECGHKVGSHGIFRARCDKCAEQLKTQ